MRGDEDKTKEQLIEELDALRSGGRPAPTDLVASDLSRTDSRFQLLLERLPAGVVYCQTDGAIAVCNPEACRVLGLSLDEVSSRYVSDWESEMLREDGSVCPVEEFAVSRCLATGKPQPGKLYGVRGPDGGVSWANYMATPVFEGEALAGALVVFADVSARQRAEQEREGALALGDTLFRVLTDHSSDGVYRADQDGRCLYANPRWHEMTGLSIEETSGYGWTEGIVAEDRELVLSTWNECVQAERDWNLEYRLVDRTGKVTWVAGTARPFRNVSGRIIGYIGINRDITTLKEARKRESLLVQELNHRVKNVLATVVGLTRESARSSESVAVFVETITARIAAMARIHEALSLRSWGALDVEEIIRLAVNVDPAADASPFTLRGPACTLSSNVAMALGQALYELNANAVRHGALRVESGRVDIVWKRHDNGQTCMSWTESGGPELERMPQPGVGLSLIQGLIGHEIGGTVTLGFPRAGARHHIVVPRSSSREGEP